MKYLNKDIETIIAKLLTGKLTPEEKELLDSWLEEKDNLKRFDDFVRTDYLTSLATSDYDVIRAKSNIYSRINLGKRIKRNNLFTRITVAASIVLIMALVGVLIYEKKVEEVLVVAEANNIAPGSNKAVLTLEDGEQVVLEKGKKYSSEFSTTDGEEIVYKAKKVENVEKLRYNYLTVPRGGQFYITLSDGTKVWLNSESRLKYPVQFLKGRDRNIVLEYGEAFFEVTKAKDNEGRRFKVKVKGQEVEVLGTRFNISAYKSELSIATTLVEGKVKVEKNGNKAFLVPGQQAVTSDESKEITVRKVDVNKEMAWVNGQFIFDDESLEYIMNVLSRWYDVEVVFESEKCKNYVFTGMLERYDSIDNILEIIKVANDGDLNYRKKNKTIIIY